HHARIPFVALSARLGLLRVQRQLHRLHEADRCVVRPAERELVVVPVQLCSVNIYHKRNYIKIPHVAPPTRSANENNDIPEWRGVASPIFGSLTVRKLRSSSTLDTG